MKALLLFTGKKAVKFAENENTANMAKSMIELGCEVDTFSSSLDNMKKFLEDFAQFINKYEIIVVIGGMGDDYDKNTKEVLSAGLGLELDVHRPSVPKVERQCLERGTPIEEEDLRYITVPIGSKVFEHPDSVIPGFCIESGDQLIAMLPDNGEIYVEMFARQLLPHIIEMKNISCYFETYNVMGLKANQAKSMLGTVLDSVYPVVALYEHDKIAETLQIIATDQLFEENLEQIERVTSLVFMQSNWLVSKYKASELPSMVIDTLKKNEYTLSVAETLTGGLLAETLLNIPDGDIVVPHTACSLLNTVKHKEMGVPMDILKNYPDASEEVCIATSTSMVHKYNTDIGISINGGMAKDEHGGYNTSAYIGISTGKKVDTKRFDLLGLSLTKKQISSIYTIQALISIYEFLEGLPESVKKFDNIIEFEVDRIEAVAKRFKTRFKEHENRIARKLYENQQFQQATKQIQDLTRDTMEIESEKVYNGDSNPKFKHKSGIFETESFDTISKEETQNLEMSVSSSDIQKELFDDEVSLKFEDVGNNTIPPSIK